MPSHNAGSGRYASAQRYPSKGKSTWSSHSSDARRSSRGGILGVLLGALSALGMLFVKGISALANLISGSSKRGPIMAVLAVLVLVLCFGVFDSVTSMGKVHAHVVVGEVKAKGMTEEELVQALKDTYADRLATNEVTIYKNQEEMDKQSKNPEDSGNLSVEEQAKQTVCWTADQTTLQADIDYNALAQEAMQAGRKGPLDRLVLFLFKRKIPIEVNFNDTSFENFASTMDLTLGKAYTNSELSVENGKATATEAQDGVMVDRDELKEKLSEKLTSTGSDLQFVEEAVETPAEITTEEGQKAADKVNAAIQNGADFSYDGETWSEDAATLGSWVSTFIITDEKGNSTLSPYFDPKKAHDDISTHAVAQFADNTENVTFEKDDAGEITVKLETSGTMPQVNSAISTLNDQVFSEDASVSGTPHIDVQSTTVPAEMSLNEALNVGVISTISEYTTEYTSGAYERNNNIHLAADLLDNSIVKANGGEWSFNDTAGDCNEERGFLAAGSIVNGVTTDEIGGGICQVATTVFNAVYESGLPITERHNHSLYISSYPEGRDAAVSYDTLDLRWENETSSDILLKTSYTDSSLTVTLYGVSPGYTVETETGEWVDGDEPSTIYTYDSNYPVGYQYTKTTGRNGHSIDVTRIVTDKSGTEVRRDLFSSDYDPTDEVIVRGGTESDY